MQKLNNIDGGNPFDWGKTSRDYAKYRDIYPDIFYQKILERGLCKDGQTVLDIGTGTGVLPRNMYRFGAKWVGTCSRSQKTSRKTIFPRDIMGHHGKCGDMVILSGNF